MKKIYSLLCVIAMCVVSFSFVGCSSSDPVTEEKEIEKPSVTNYAKFTFMAVEELFELGDFVVTLEYDNQKVSYTLDEKTKVSDVKNELWESFSDGKKIAGRVLEIKPFEFNAHPVKYTGEFVFSEEGKKRMASAPIEDQMDIAIFAYLQSCNKDGAVVIPENPSENNRFFKGVYVNEFEGFLKVLKSDSSIFSQILK